MIKALGKKVVKLRCSVMTNWQNHNALPAPEWRNRCGKNKRLLRGLEEWGLKKERRQRGRGEQS